MVSGTAWPGWLGWSMVAWADLLSGNCLGFRMACLGEAGLAGCVQGCLSRFYYSGTVLGWAGRAAKDWDWRVGVLPGCWLAFERGTKDEIKSKTFNLIISYIKPVVLMNLHDLIFCRERPNHWFINENQYTIYSLKKDGSRLYTYNQLFEWLLIIVGGSFIHLQQNII